MSAWLPTGKLNDGTLLFGPLKEKAQADLGRHTAFEFQGRTWHVVHSGGELSPEQISEVRNWAENSLLTKTVIFFAEVVWSD
jgi:hypothetical protein